MFVRRRVKYCVEFLSNCFHFQSARVKFSRNPNVVQGFVCMIFLYTATIATTTAAVSMANGKFQQEMRSIRFFPRQINIPDTRTYRMRYCIDKLIFHFKSKFNTIFHHPHVLLLLLLLLAENYSNRLNRIVKLNSGNFFFSSVTTMPTAVAASIESFRNLSHDLTVLFRRLFFASFSLFFSSVSRSHVRFGSVCKQMVWNK